MGKLVDDEIKSPFLNGNHVPNSSLVTVALPGVVFSVFLTLLSEFSDAWKSRWVNSEHKSDYGQFKLTAGNFYGDAEKDKGKSLHVIRSTSKTTTLVQ